MRVAIAHVCTGFGGSEAKVMWGIKALKDDHEVTLLTVGDVDLAAMNAFYGTSIRPGEVTVRRTPRLLRSACRGDALRSGVFQRFCRSVAERFDLLVSAYNPIDFGVPAIHCVADFSWHRDLREQLDPIPRHAQRFIHRDGWMREAYLALGRRLAKPSGRDLFAGDDVLIANSEFTADLLRERLGVPHAPVVYPPVTGAFQHVAFEERERGFICLGRVSHEKRIEMIIRILARVRSLGHDVHLHVVGSIPETPYGRYVRALCAEHRTWVFADGQKAGAAKWDLLSRHRFALHARPGEAFGIAVAEMAKAGCITFVPEYGGPAEIVGDDRLCYHDEDDAVAKIARVLDDVQLQRSTSAELTRRARRFSPERFITDFRAAVSRFAEARRGRGMSRQPERHVRDPLAPGEPGAARREWKS